MGNYVLGRLEGQAKMVMADGACRHCWAQGAGKMWMWRGEIVL